MSEMYEGVVFRGDEPTARRAFNSLSSSVQLRLVPLAPCVFGVYRATGRADTIDQPQVEQLAKQISAETSRGVGLFYDNSCGIEIGILYDGGVRMREFGGHDAWWVPYGEDGMLLDGPRLRESEMQPDQEYDCVFSAIDAALAAIEAGPQVSASLVKQAFCYDETDLLAESPAAADGGRDTGSS